MSWGQCFSLFTESDAKLEERQPFNGIEYNNKAQGENGAALDAFDMGRQSYLIVQLW